MNSNETKLNSAVLSFDKTYLNCELSIGLFEMKQHEVNFSIDHWSCSNELREKLVVRQNVTIVWIYELMLLNYW